jgi:hypothetical protein
LVYAAVDTSRDAHVVSIPRLKKLSSPFHLYCISFSTT